MAIASGLNLYRGDSFTFEMNIFTYAKNLSLRRDVSELVASSFGGARGEEARKFKDSGALSQIRFEALTCCLGVKQCRSMF